MSSVKEDEVISEKKDTMMSCCASCGAAEGDDVQLKKCNGCYLVRYCGLTCQRNHRLQHKKACKKRAAELRDELLFQQPESSYLGDCPICCLPFPVDDNKYVYHSCCSKSICKGCTFSNAKRLIEERLDHTCPFCRSEIRRSDIKQPSQKMMKRVQANDPSAISEIGIIRCQEGNHAEALQYFTKAAELGHANAHCNLSIMYRKGEFVEKDEKKFLYHAEEAAIKGHLGARCGLAEYEMEKFRPDRAVKHLTIAANLGHDNSMEALKIAYKGGMVSKEDFASALRAHKAAADEMKSPQRDAVEAFEAAGKK